VKPLTRMLPGGADGSVRLVFPADITLDPAGIGVMSSLLEVPR
jgi:hypothetical protein